MSELSPKALALLEKARRDHGPSEEDRERVLGNLHASLGIAAALPILTESGRVSATQLSSPGAANAAPVEQVASHVGDVASSIAGKGAAAKLGLGSKLLAWKAGKVWLASLVLGGAATATVLPRHHEPTATRVKQVELDARASQAAAAPSEAPAKVPAVAAEAEREPSAVAPVPTTPSVAQAVEPTAAPTVAPGGVAPADATSPASIATAAPQVERAEPAVVAPSDVPRKPSARPHASTSAISTRVLRRETRLASRLAEREPAPMLAPAQPSEPPLTGADLTPSSAPAPPELALIRRALTSLRDHEPTQALVLLDEHAARFPNGAFGTERAGLRVIALCASGRREEGQRQRAEFLASQGKSPIAARVRSACVDKAPQ